MAFQQYTHCTDTYDGMCGILPDLWYALGHGIVGGFLGSGLGAILGGLFGPAAFWGAVAAGFFYGFFDGLCERYENHRLLCIGHDQCALGRVVFQEPPSSKSGFDAIDNDYSLNLMLAPHFETDDKDSVWNDGLQGEHFLRQRFGPPLQYQGYVDVPSDYLSKFPPTTRNAVLEGAGGKWSLHCEFEGSRMHAICTAGKILAPLAGAAAVIAYFACGDSWWGLLCALAALIVAMAAALGIGWLAGQDGSPADAAVDPDSGTLGDGDCIVVTGDLVYDAGHCEGWHEIHPVKHVQKLQPIASGDPDRPMVQPACPQGDLNDPTFFNRVNDLINRWCQHLQEASAPQTKDAQRQPENRWCVHPELGGCQIPGPG